MFVTTFCVVVDMDVRRVVRKEICDVSIALAIAASITLVGCATTATPGVLESGFASRDADRLLIVDCLLPGQLRRLGRSITFLTPRRPVKVPTSECEIRGGEYVAYDRANFATSLKIWLPQAKEGDPDAQTYVGEIFEKGLGLQADPVVAAQWYQKAADQGHSRARINLGYLYESGLGVEKDLVKAMNFYRLASGFDEGNLEYVTAFEVATRKQQVIDLEQQAQQITELKQSVSLLEQKNNDYKIQQTQLKAQQLQVQEQRQVVLAQQSSGKAVQGDASELVASLTQVDQLQSNLSASEAQRNGLVERFQAQQLETERLQNAYSQSSVELRQARQELSEQEQTLTKLQEKVSPTESIVSSTALLEIESKLAAAQESFDADRAKAEASQRALAQETASLQTQIVNARARENSLQAELGRVVDNLSGAEVNSAALEIQIRSQVEAHRQQTQQMRRQLSVSSQELLLVQSKLEEAQGAVAGLGDAQLAAQRDLGEKRLASEVKITELESQIASAMSREQVYRRELAQLSGNSARSKASKREGERALNEQIALQQNDLGDLRSQLAQSKTERENVLGALEAAQVKIASSSLELNAVRNQMIQQKGLYDEQITAAFQAEQSLVLELQELEEALDSGQVRAGMLQRRLDDNLTTAKQQAEQFASQLARSEREIDEAKVALEQSAAKYNDQSVELLEVRSLLEQQQGVLSVQQNITEKQDGQLQAEIERLSARTIDSDVRNQRLTTEINVQQEEIATLTAQYSVSSRALSQADSRLGDQQEQIVQLSDELQRVRFNSMSQLAAARAELNQNKEALREAQTLYEQIKGEADRLTSQQSAGSKELENQLAAANEIEQGLKQQLEEASVTTTNLQRQLVEQEQQYRYELAAAKGKLEMARDESNSSLVRLAGLESQLSDQEGIISEQESVINELQTRVTRTQAAAAKNPGQFIQPTSNSGPAIAIVEPEMLVTRGGPALKISGGSSGSVDVIGTVQPSDNILSFKIDGETVPLNDNGVFTYTTDSTAPILRMLAIDDSGGRTDLEVKFSQTEGVVPVTEDATDLSSVNFGSYHALIIGNNNFANLQNLKTAERDAVTVEKLLREKYGFQTTLLLDATRYDMLSAMNKMRETLTSEDNLLIYYAGHGEIANSTGYWLPVDAEPGNDANWIANATITKYVETMNAKHVIVVADSCYSGTLSRTSLARLSKGLTGQQQRKWYETVASSKVRTVFTSGGVKPVLDSVGDSRHSVFSTAFIDELESSSSQVVSTYKLFLKVQERVKAEAARIGVDQNPQYSPMQFAGHESGEFLFILDGKSGSATLDTQMDTLSDAERKVASN